MPLAQVLLAHAGIGGPAPEAMADLERRIEALLAQARASWPTVALAPELFVRHLAERLGDGELDGLLATTHAGDLYLACGCTHGDGQALLAFDGGFITQIPLFLARHALPPGAAEEVQQAVRVRLLVAAGQTPPRIARYTGRGPLGGWLRMVTARVLVDLRRSGGTASGAAPGDPDQLESALLDPELAFVRQESRAAIEAAVAAALGTLSEREATMLKLHLLEGLSATTIGRLIGVGERTTRRWLAETRAKVAEETRRRLAIDAPVSATELGRLFQLVQSELDVSVRRLLMPRSRSDPP